MYERSAIVLEKYFENLFGFNKPSNLRQNYTNYCELFEKFNSFQNANNEEFKALEEFQEAENVIEDIQKEQEKLYKKSAKYEYNRDLVFNDITQKPEEIEACMTKIESDIAKVQNSLVTLREKFVEAVRNYNEKKSALSKCKKTRRSAEAEYNAIFEVTKQNIENISEEYIAIAKGFSAEEGQDDLIDTMLDNGKDEKIPFNNSVVRNAVRVSFDIQKRFIDAYMDAYNKTNKLIGELLEGAVSVELHEKTIRNIGVKVNFLNAEKDYLVQFLDYERIMVIHGKRTHRNLMLEACESFETDVAQIDNLYTLLLKEISNKSTKKAYKELYNKSYLIDIEENDEKFKKEKNKVKLSTATIMNTNYWRIEGIKNIYTVFYKDVVEVFGKDVDEFEVPKEQDDLDAEESLFEKAEADAEELEIKAKAIEPISEDAPALPGMAEAVEENEKIEKAKKATAKAKKAKAEDIVQAVEEPKEAQKAPEIIETVEEPEIVEVSEAPKVAEIVKEEKTPKKKAKKVKRYTRKKVQKDNVMVAEVPEIPEEKSFDDLFDEVETEPDIFGEKYRDIEKQIAELDELDNVFKVEETKKNEKVDTFEKIEEAEELPEIDNLDEDMPYEDEDIPYEEESIFENIENEDYKELNLDKAEKKSSKKSSKVQKAEKKAEKKKTGILKNIIKLNSKSKKKVVAN